MSGGSLRDDHFYNWVMFETESVRFFIRALTFYEELLKNEQSAVDDDPILKDFITDETRRELRVAAPVRKAQVTREWLEKQLGEEDSRWDVSLSFDHGTARYLKSVGLLYLGMVKAKRNALSAKPNVSSSTLDALDRQITKYEEILANAGVFKNAAPLPLIAAQTLDLAPDVAASSQDVPLTRVHRPRPVVIGSIEILDEELRSRCLDLLQNFNSDEQHDRYDTVIAEAARVLEHRLRTLAGVDDGSTAVDLISLIFSKDAPLLVLSNVASEQQAAQLLFRGFFGYVRNPVQHRLIGELRIERVVRILGMVDYLLNLLRGAERGEVAAQLA